MITRFKIYEGMEELKLEDHSCWVIYGSQSHCVNILNKLRLNLNSYLKSDLNVVIGYIKKNIKDNTYTDAIGTIIFYQEQDNFSYYPYVEKVDRDAYLKNYNFKGEMKEIDGKIIVDTIEVYVNKYNL